MNFNFNQTPNDPNARIVFYNRCSICILLFIIGILCGRYFYGRRNPQVKQPESPIITETPKQPELLPTPTPEASPKPPIQQLPEENPSENQPTLKVPINPSEEQMSCLKYGGGAACLADQYQPNIPEPLHTPEPSIPKQLPPIIPDIPNFRLDTDPDVSNIAIAVISGREVPDWTPNYDLPPMSPGVCPPSWVIAYQDQLFCNRRRILKPSQAVRRFRRFGY